MKRPSLLLPLLLLASGPSVQAAIVYSGVENVPIPLNLAGVYLNILTKATVFSQPADFDTAPWISMDFGGIDISNGDALLTVINGTSQVVNLLPGDSVGSPSNLPPGANFSDAHTGPGSGQFALQTVGFAGFGFRPAPAAPLQYGWLKLTISNNSAGTIHEWAYESTPGASILVGAVPEPTGAALALIGTATLWLRRRRQA